ncbi:spermidine/putrescine ABC transporter ATPase [Oceanobacillus picturae]|uniref:Spermidine/putrescine ABC transporter ATPase n=1 Tax=Oceanobacillus picturae TaxID=171693 RepID=A0A0U9H6I6_9BACI|nr:hypothetical protein [Oceanobacillus picturae]GAQ18011.1 spermidine/putrescine ABC transporter ATPase [Oceanobacillus picturae]
MNLKQIKKEINYIFSSYPNHSHLSMSKQQAYWLIQQAEEKRRLEEKLKYLESRGLQEINLGNVGVDANELVDEVRQALEESQ